MKLLNASQIHQWDQITIQNQQLTSLELMERAAKKCVDWIVENLDKKSTIYIFCGRGNNGGDGLAIAKLLLSLDFNIQVNILAGEKSSADFEANLKALKSTSLEINELHSANDFPKLEANCYVVDALFGSGINKPLNGLPLELANYLNNFSPKKVIAIDVPSGMFLDHSSYGNTIIQADEILTFQTYKQCFFIAENAQYLGNIHVLDIGLDAEFPYTQESNFEITDANFAKNIYQPRNPFGHKGTFGHALLIAGSQGKYGAALMAAHACLRTGVGLLTCNFPEEIAMPLAITLPEAMSMKRNETIDWDKYKSIGIGPGLGMESFDIIKDVLTHTKSPLLIDADGLNMIAANDELKSLIPQNAILTPHPKEFERLFGKTANEFDRIDLALQKSQELHCVIVLKGHNTLIAADGVGYFNTTGNVGLATGGSGDTLSGIITSLLAQGYISKNAAILGVYLHGLAADLALSKQSVESLLPSDLNQYLGMAFKSLG
ncbi:NAD(P)H-hydrate dehydratase [Rhizosphaericola mali]|uniref:Bifunctional NAD(P)H-hydrate repair enzyme n=1 Tax=Rhizosphaericola mali TaxID=2545455 RepID=A0A5P2FX86_9BACT|nr:NAD(P)H-hydrate dehydratase [Rhizosphaericola mali]QES87537.1 NAD(P)H-hydrate dehydratase [Rhizosphaericola mali]